MKELAQWQQEYLNILRKMTVGELLNEAFESQIPDDCDGGMTDKGTWRADASRLKLYERLLTLGIIDEGDIQAIREFVGRRRASRLTLDGALQTVPKAR